MDKRGAKILISCILCAVIVLVLFIIALRYSQMSCELISIDPQHLRQAQLESFNNNKKHKPTRSHDKMILMKISAYLEYNIAQTGPNLSEKPASSVGGVGVNESAGHGPIAATSPASTVPASPTTTNSNNQVVQPQQQQQQVPPFQGAGNNQQQAKNLNNNNNNNLAPRPSNPQLGFTTNQHLFLNSTPTSANNGPQSSFNQQQQQQQQLVSERFLPLNLESIETRSLSADQSGTGSGVSGATLGPGNGGSGGGTGAGSLNNLATKQKYILFFNCTKLSMVFAYKGDRVYVQSMSLDLSPKSHQETSCDLQLPETGAFGVDSSLSSATNHSSPSANFAHYYCNKKLSYNCHYYSKSGLSPNNGMLLAVLHINSIEFETYTGSSKASSSNSNNNKKHTGNSKGSHGKHHHNQEHKHVEREFKTKPMICVDVPADQTSVPS